MFKNNPKLQAIFLCALLSACGGSADTASSPSPNLRTSETVASGTSGTQPGQQQNNGQTDRDPSSGTPSSCKCNTPEEPAFVYDETARFTEPENIAVDTAGNIYVVDDFSYLSANKSLRKIAANGQVSTLPVQFNLGVASTYADNLSVDKAGNVYTSDVDDTGLRIIKIAPDGSQTDIVQWIVGNQMKADLKGNLYVLHHESTSFTTIQKITPDGSITPFFSRTGYVSGPMATDKKGNLYVLDYDTVWKMPSSGLSPTVYVQYDPQDAGVKDMTLDAEGNVYISRFTADTSDCHHSRCPGIVTYTGIDKIKPDGTLVNVISYRNGLAGSGDERLADGYGTAHIALGPHGNLYVSFENKKAIYKITPSGAMTLVAGAPGIWGNSD